MLKWLCDNDFINNREMKTTHTLMTGGVVGVPDGMYDDFLALYAMEVKRKNKTLSFSELKSDPVFCMYFDIDLLDTGVTSIQFSDRMISLIQRVIKSYYTNDTADERFLCVVCDTDAKEIEKDGEPNLTKNGYHITFPNLRVNLSQALQIRYSVVYELEKTMGARPAMLNAWSDVIDRAPYANGLKMCGSFKRIKCTDCKKNDPMFKERKKTLLSFMAKLRRKMHPRDYGFDYTDLADIHQDEFKDAVFGDMYGKYLELTGFNSCRTCLNTGKRIETRTCMPSLVLDGGGDPDTSLLDILREDYFKVMKYTSIRFHEDQSETLGFAIPKGVPTAPTEENGANMRSFSSKKLAHLGSDMHAFTINNDMYLSDAQMMHLWKGPRVEDQARLSTIEKFVRENVCQEYSSVQIRRVCESQLIRKVGQSASSGSKMITSLVGAHSGTTPSSPAVNVSNRYMVNIAGVGSTFCMNKGAEHTSNSVYFIITSSHCFQRCFSRKPDVRDGGTTCAEYRSGGVPIPEQVSAILFPSGKQPVKKRHKTTPTPTSTPCVSVKKTITTKRRRRTTIDWATKKL